MDSIFLSELGQRGFVHQTTEGFAEFLLKAKKPLKAYIGFDGTADSLHVGSLLPMMLLRWWQKCGHIPVVVLGGGTSRVGDPSGRDESRRLLSPQKIDGNLKRLEKIFRRFLSFEGANAAIIRNNDDWLKKLNLLDFLRAVGPHFSLGRMLSFDSVRLRLERQQNLSFLEFSYMALQAYDFYHLAKHENCFIQMGGADQWGNIVCGVELNRRLLGKSSHGLTAPLALTADGAKMGKTAEGAVWLDREKLSPSDYWQYWRNVADADVKRCLLLFTELPQAEIKRLTAARGRELNQAKKTLATLATAMCHGQKAARAAAESAKKLFEENAPAEPSFELAVAELNMSAFELFVVCGLCASRGEARRLIRGGGGRLNDVLLSDENRKITAADLRDGLLKLSAGKKRKLVIRAV